MQKNDFVAIGGKPIFLRFEGNSGKPLLFEGAQMEIFHYVGPI
jgi:hypothetical protein